MKSDFQKKESRKFWIFLSCLLVLLGASFLLSLFLGTTRLSSLDNEIALSIFLKLRLPRSILVLLCGMLMAGSGYVFQLFFRNPLAEPGIMGVTSGATLGAVCSFLLPTSISLAAKGSAITIFAFTGAILTGLLVFLLSKKSPAISSSVSIILIGTALGTLFSAVTSIIILAKQNQLHAIYVWLLGSFSGRGWNEVYFVAIPSAISFVLFGFCSRFLKVMGSGEKQAQALGVNLEKARLLVLVSGSLATASSVCCGGTIGFVGLICPHIIRKLYGVKGFSSLLLSVLSGGVLLLLSDTLARIVLNPQELPVGIITSIIGAPIFISILMENRK